MVNNKHIKLFLIGGLIMTLLLIFLPVIYTNFYHNITGTPKSENASIDLSSVNLKDGKIYLDGQWEFYWNSFIVSEPKQYTKNDFLIEVPGEWSHYKINGERLPAGGIGSYKLELTGLAYNKSLTLYIPDFGGAYRVFIDGQLTAESGIASKNIDEVSTVPKAELYPLTLTDLPTHEVVIEVATTRFSGLYMTPILMDYQRTVNDSVYRSAIRFILFGIALFAFIILIAMYMLAIRRKWQSFWMPIMILFILIRIMLTTEFYSFWQPILFNNLSYESTNELMYFTTFVLKYLLVFLVEEQCGIAFRKREKIGFIIYYSALFLIYLLVPQVVYNQYLSVLIPMLTFVLDIYLFIKIYRGRDKMIKFGLEIFFATYLIIIGMANDSLYINGKIFNNTTISMMLYFTVFSIIMSGVYALRIGDLYDDFTVSSSRLLLANEQIVMQKEYYETLSTQMREIRVIKHDIGHFIGVISHLVEEEKFLKLKEFISEYCESAKMDQLPIFCENTVANSIIGYYYLRAKEYGIRFESHCNISEQTIMSDNDLCIIFGNALENAVHACKQMKGSQKQYISIEADRKKGLHLVKVKNSYQGPLTMVEGRYVSLKLGNAHGFGIQNIEKVVKTYNGLVKIEHDEKEFTVMVVVPVHI